MTDEGAVTCARCGATAATAPVTWTMSAAGGRTSYYCEQCSREHLRSIEAGLAPEWW